MSEIRLNPRPSAKVMLGYSYSIVLFALTVFFGIGGPGDFADSTNALQRMCSGAVIAYGILGLLGIIGLVSKQRWVFAVTLLWAVMLTATAFLAPLAWAPGRVSWLNTLLGTGFAAAIGWTVYLVVRWLVRRKQA